MGSIDDRDAALAPSLGAGSITARLKRAITTGVYADGDRIPPERQLALAYSAARSTVRRALDQLEDDGLVVRRVGSGTFVTYAGPFSGNTGEIADLISPLQLIEARLAAAENKGLIERDAQRIRPTGRGRVFLNDLVALFLPAKE